MRWKDLMLAAGDFENSYPWRDIPGVTDQMMLQAFSHEMEHIESVGGDSGVILAIALDHLVERPDYYKVLKKAGL